MLSFPLPTDTLYAAVRQVTNLDLLTIDLPLDQCTCLPIVPGIVLSVCAETFNATPYAETFNATPVINYLAWLSSSANPNKPLNTTHCGPWHIGTRTSLHACVMNALFRLSGIDPSTLGTPGGAAHATAGPPPPPPPSMPARPTPTGGDGTPFPPGEPILPFPVTADTLEDALRQLLSLDLLTIDLPLRQFTCLPLTPDIVLSIYVVPLNDPPETHYVAWLSNGDDPCSLPPHTTRGGPWRFIARMTMLNHVIDALLPFTIDPSLFERPRGAARATAGPPPPPAMPARTPRGKRNRNVQRSLT